MLSPESAIRPIQNQLLYPSHIPPNGLQSMINPLINICRSKEDSGMDLGNGIKKLLHVVDQIPFGVLIEGQSACDAHAVVDVDSLRSHARQWKEAEEDFLTWGWKAVEARGTDQT